MKSEARSHVEKKKKKPDLQYVHSSTTYWVYVRREYEAKK